jgi:hypothetical protein
MAGLVALIHFRVSATYARSIGFSSLRDNFILLIQQGMLIVLRNQLLSSDL